MKKGGSAMDYNKVAGKPENNFTELATLPDFILKWIDNNSDDIVVVGDHNAYILFVSKSVKSILGYEGPKLLGYKWRNIIPSKDVGLIQTYINEKKNDQLFSLNIRICNNLGEYIWFELNMEKIKDESNNNFYILAKFKHILDKVEIDEMIVGSEKMSVVGQLAAGIAHEIRNPLTSLKGFLQLLQAGVGQKDEYYKIMGDEIDKIEAITSELLFLSKPMTNKKDIESVNSMISDIVLLLRPQARLRDIELKWMRLSEKYIYCDRSQIKQVLINLIKNAIEAMETSGVIEIRVRQTDISMEIDVIDEGPGIPSDIIHKIGEPFFTTKQSGTGLGLMITKQILEQHDGKITIIQNNGKGSTFRIIFPKQK